MSDSGKPAVRSLMSFGVSGLLGDDCKVYYSNLFSSRHLGRVSDLICARLGEFGLDELRLRAVLLFGFFEAYRAQGDAADGPLAEPLVIECGMDSERVAVGMVFRTGFKIDAAGLEARLGANKPNGKFEELLSIIHRHADRLIVRHEPGVQTEVVALMNPFQEALPVGGTPAPAEVVLFGDQAPAEKTPKAGEYIEIGDLDYATLLDKDSPGKKLAAPPTGEFLARGCTELEEAIRLRAQAAAIEERLKISGKVPEQKEEVFRFSGKGKDLVDQSVTRVAGDESTELADSLSGKRKKGILETVLSLGEEEAVENALDTEEGVDNGSEAVTGEGSGEKEAGSADAAETTVSSGPSDTEVAASNLVSEIEGGSFDRTLRRVQEEYREIKKEVTSAKVKNWMDGLMGELVQEKSRLHELTKTLHLSIRQKELEFKNKEVVLKEELRRRDEMVRQKNTALNRTKEQLAHVTTLLEKSKGAGQENAEDTHFKQKYNLSQKLLQASKDENARLMAKIEDLRSQVSSAQMGLRSRSGGAPSQTEFSALKVKHERVQRQAEELRNLNEQLSTRIQQLTDRMNEARPGAMGSGELAKKLEAAVKQVALTQRDAEQMKLKVEELQREEARLKMELKRSQLELKTAKTVISRGGGPKAA